MRKLLVSNLLIAPMLTFTLAARGQSALGDPMTVGVRQVAANLTAPVALVEPRDGSRRLFIVDQIGLIRVLLPNGQLLPEPFLDVRDRLVTLRPNFDGGVPLRDPVIEYANARQAGGGLGLVVVGGHVYRGGELSQLRGRYVFGDWSRSFGRPDGSLLAASSRKSGLWPIQDLQVHNRPNGRLGHFILGFGRDARGEVYVLTSDSVGPSGNTGRVYRLVKPGR